MGLDNFFSGRVEGNFRVCGGMFSGHGNESFRGKVYWCVVNCITEVDLYDPEISNEKLREMVKLLEQATPERVRRADSTLSFDEFKELVRMFKAHAEAGHSIKSWY